MAAGLSGVEGPSTADDRGARRYVALLRGVNLGGHNTVPMAGLRAVFADLGFTDVTTLIQSGNVVFSAAVPPEPGLLEEQVRERFSVTTTVVVRDGAQIRRVVEANPFRDVDPSRVHVAFLPVPADLARLDGFEVDAFAPDRLVAGAGEIYYDLPGGMARAKLPGAVERRLKVAGTIRNLRTTLRLAEIVAGEPPRR